MIIVYFNNILIYFNNLADYKRYVKEVLSALKKYSLFTKLEKYKFNINTIKFLSYIISPKGIFIDLVRIFTIIK